VHTICSNNNRALKKVHIQVGLTIQINILHFLFANHLVAEFQLVVVSRNQPIVPRKYKHGCFTNNHICIFFEKHVNCEKKPVETLQEDDVKKKWRL